MQVAKKLRCSEEEYGINRSRTQESLEKHQELREAAVSGLMKVTYTQTEQNFPEVWTQYRLKFEVHQSWLNYLEKQ